MTITKTLQHIEDLDVDAWAAMTRRAAVDAVAAAQRRGVKPSSELVAVARMTERELVEHRQRNGPASQRLSPLMRLVQAEHLHRMAEDRARDAHQDKLDADATASVARVEAEASARAASTAREHARAARAQAAEQENERAAERAEHEQAVQRLRGELEQVRADTAAEVAAAREQVTAADARAEQRTAERAAERAEHEQAVQLVRAEIEDARAYADAEVAAARGWATGEVSAVRDAAGAEVARAHAAADHAIHEAQAVAARKASMHLLMIPIPPLEVRPQTRRIENALNAVHQIDYILEVGIAQDAESYVPPDIELVRSLVWTVREHAMHLSGESPDVATDYTTEPPVDAADSYRGAAAAAFRAFLRRIDTVAETLTSRDRSPDAEIVDAVTAMLADPWVQHLSSLGPESS